MGLILLTALLGWGAYHTGPLLLGGAIQPLPAALAGLAALGLLRIVIESLTLLARLVDWLGAQTATGKSGTAHWARGKDLKDELSRKKTGPFWGVMFGKRGHGGKPLFIDYVSNAMTVAPAGSGKGVCTVVPAGLAIRFAKVFSDFKGELVCILKAALERCGEKVRVLNPGGLWLELVGEGDSYNPQDIIVENLHHPGGLRDIPDVLREYSAQIQPEPRDSDGENIYWREGGRRIIADVSLIDAMVDEFDSTLPSVALIIEDRIALEHHCRWVVGVDLENKPLPEGPMPIESSPWAKHHDPDDVKAFARWVRSRASSQLQLMSNVDSKTFDSFLSGAQQALAPFAYSRLALAMRRSTFSMNELKEGNQPTNLFIVADASRMEAYKAYIGLIQWCAMTAVKRHPNKARPVYFIMDELTNYKIHDLENLLTWGRSYGLRLHLIFQDLSAFERTYGKTALETLLSETEIKQFLPGQRSPRTLEMIQKMLGEQSVMSASLSPQARGLHEQMSENPRPLMTADEIRRTSAGLLLVRRAPPVLFEPISYAEIHPWRKLAGINPFHGKPYLKKVRLTL